MNVYKLRVTLSETCLLKAARSYMVVNRLEEMGNIIKTEPPVEALENEEFDMEFSVYVGSSLPPEDIRQAARGDGADQVIDAVRLRAVDRPHLYRGDGGDPRGYGQPHHVVQMPLAQDVGGRYVVRAEADPARQGRIDLGDGPYVLGQEVRHGGFPD